MKNLELIRKISDIEAIAIFDIIQDEPDITKKYDDNFKTLIGRPISLKSHFYPWVPIRYTDAKARIDKSKNIPRGIEFIQFISVKHIGVAHEIICYCKIDKQDVQKESEKYFKEDLKKDVSSQLHARIKSGIDLQIADNKIEQVITNFFKDFKMDLTEFQYDFKELESIIGDTVVKEIPEILYNYYLNSRFDVLIDIQLEVEKYFKDIIPGIFLSNYENTRDTNCISAFIYDITNFDFLIIQEAQNETADIEKVRKWISSFDYKSSVSDMDFSGNYLTSLGLNNSPTEQQFLSLIGQRFIAGYGGRYKENKLGSYNNRFIIFKLRNNANISFRDELSYENVLMNLSKFLLPTHWIRFRLKELEDLKSKEKEKMPVITHDKSTRELSIALEKMFGIYDNENVDRIENIDFFAKIQEELKWLESLKSTLTVFPKEITEEGITSLSKALYNDINFWLERIRKEIQDIRYREDLRVQLMQNNIDVTTSFINNKLQKSVEFFTKVIVLLTFALILLALGENSDVLNWIMNSVRNMGIMQ